MTAFLHLPADPGPGATTHEVAVVLDRHPTNAEAARILDLAGFRGVHRTGDGRAVVRAERFGRDPELLRAELALELASLTTADILE